MRSTISVLTTTIAMLLLSLASGCSKDDDSVTGPENNASIVGAWDLTGMTSQDGSFTYVVPAEEIAADPLAYTFFEENTGIQYYQGDEIYFDWSIEGTTLTTVADWGQTNSYTYSASSSTLELQFPSDGYTVTHIFTKR